MISETCRINHVGLKTKVIIGAHLSTFEFGGHANLAGLSLLDIRASLDSP